MDDAGIWKTDFFEGIDEFGFVEVFGRGKFETDLSQCDVRLYAVLVYPR